jgi:hypothetical protein
MIKQTLAIITIAVVFWAVSIVGISAAEERLLLETDLEYLGAFRVPQGDFGSPQYSGFNYGGTALTHNPHNNSLFMVGHTWYQLTAEISIPQFINSTNLADLNTATVLQPFADITEGNRANIGEGGAAVETSGVPIGGFFVSGEKLVGTAFGYYDAGYAVKLSHFTSGLDLSENGDFHGMYQVGEAPTIPNPAFIDGYMTDIPPEWQSRFGGPALTGNCCLSIISRTSLGPAASVFDPDKLGLEDPVPATPVVGYPIDHPTLGTYGDQRPDVLYNGSMMIKGMVFPQGSRTVLFFGRRGTGIFCYGEGKSDPALHNTYCDPEYPEVLCCYDPADTSKGGHAYPYVYLVLAYDALDLLSVKSGEKEMWEILPYGVWELNFPFANDNPSILGAAYDPSTQRIYISQDGGDKPGCCGHLPLIHVYHVNIGSNNTCPSCTGGAVILNGVTFPPGETCACSGTTISLQEVTVPRNATANFSASTSILIGSGTTFEDGSSATLTSPSTTFQSGSQIASGAALNVRQ